MHVAQSYTKANTSHVAGYIYAIGPGGDDDPKYALEEVVFSNTGTVALYLGHSLTDILANARYQYVAAAGTAGCNVVIGGPIDNLIVYNPHASTTGSWAVQAMCRCRNSGQDAGVLCAEGLPALNPTRYQIIRPTRTAGSTITTTVPVKYRRLMTTIKAYSVSVPTGGTLTIDVLDWQNRSLLTAVLNQESPTTKTLYTAATFTATATDLLTIAKGCDLTLSSVSSAGGDPLGDILIELAHTVA